MPPQIWPIIIMAMGCICPVPLGNCKCHQGGRVHGTTHQIAEDRFGSFGQLGVVLKSSSETSPR